MKNTTRISFFIATFMATGLTATFATASTHTHWKVKDHTASGSAFLYDVCESTGVDFGGSESTTHSGGGQPVQDNLAWASYWSYNWCNGAQTNGWAYVPGGFSGDMNSASFDIQFEADSYEWIEVDGEFVYHHLGTSTVEISADLTGVGQAIHGMNSSTSRWGSTSSRYRWIGQWKEASVDLSVTVDGNPVDLGDATGSLGRSNSGSVDIYE